MRVAIYTAWYRAWAYFRSAINIRTIWNVLASFFIGIKQFIHWSIRFVNADSKSELKAADPTRHEKVTQFRALVYWTALGGWSIGWLLFVINSPRPRLVVGAALLVHVIIFILIGRSGALLVQVQTAKIAGEMRLRQIVDEITLTVAQRNPESSSYAGTSEIVDPPARLASNKGYDVVIRVNSKGQPDKLLSAPNLVAHKLQKGRTMVFVYKVHNDGSLVRILVLNKDPWSEKPTTCPLVARPRMVNLWKEKADLGTKPDYTAFIRALVEEGEGGGLIVAGAPRKGKSTFLSTLLVYLMLDPTVSIHLVDGSAVDYAMIKNVVTSYIGDADSEDIDILRQSHRVLKGLKKEISRRKALLLQEGKSKLSEEMAMRLQLGTHWFMVDELAVITEDLYNSYKSEVEAFTDDLVWLARTGPKYGVIPVVATQRPTARSIPPAMKGMVVFRACFYVASSDASLAVLGKGGLENRADKLDPDSKGVAIATGVGQFRGHNTSTDDLRRIAPFAASIRAQYNPTQVQQSPDAEWPEPVKTIMGIMTRLDVDKIETTELVDELHKLGHKRVNDINLAASLKRFNVRPKRPYFNGVQGRGYVRADFEKVQKAVSFAPASSDSKTDQDGSIAGGQVGSEAQAMRTKEEGS